MKVNPEIRRKKISCLFPEIASQNQQHFCSVLVTFVFFLIVFLRRTGWILAKQMILSKSVQKSTFWSPSGALPARGVQLPRIHGGGGGLMRRGFWGIIQNRGVEKNADFF